MGIANKLIHNKFLADMIVDLEVTAGKEEMEEMQFNNNLRMQTEIEELQKTVAELSERMVKIQKELAIKIIF